MSGDTARSMSVRARINNLAKELGIAPQHALQRYFTERFLARVAASPYANNLVIKGGALMSAILGVANTRLRDFYDLHMLWARREFKAEILAKAIRNTFANRHSEEYWANRLQIVESLKVSQPLAEQWQRYCRKTPFARDIAYAQVVESVENLIAAAQSERSVR